MSVPEKLLAMIRRFESLRLKAYRCPAGVWTIGYGATGPDIVAGLVWMPEQCEDRLQRDAPAYYNGASRLCPGVSGDPLIALSDFAYNLGLSRLSGSTLRRRVNAEDMAGAAVEIVKWVHCGGVKLPGLVIRRQVEKGLLLA